LLKGDCEIFQRLVEKVEEINRSTKQGESVLKLYDPEAEERYIAEQGILPGNVQILETAAASADPEADSLEALLAEACLGDDDDLRDFLLGDSPEDSPVPAAAVPEPSRLRLYGDREFLLQGYQFLSEQDSGSNFVPIEEHGKVLTITAPSDLKRRLGAPDQRGDVIFGSTAIPAEGWPQHGQFRLTSDPDQVELAILAARNMSGYWSKELLCTEQHPIPLWITERLLMQMKRGEAPIISSRHLEKGELCFCFIGQVSSHAGSPLIVDAHAISFRMGGRFEHRPLRAGLAAAKFDQLANTGLTPNLAAAQGLIPSAVKSSLDHMRSLRQQRDVQLLPFLRREERRLRNWCHRRRALLEQRIEDLGEQHPRSKQYRKQLAEMDEYVRERQKNWQETHIKAANEPSTRLILVLEGAG
jgi:hypothetical protein